jgi:hypothetical protein
MHSAKYIVKIFQVFLFRLTGHDHIIEYTLVLKTYSGEKLHSLGVMRVHVQYNDQCSYLNSYMVKRGGPALFG